MVDRQHGYVYSLSVASIQVEPSDANAPAAPATKTRYLIADAKAP